MIDPYWTYFVDIYSGQHDVKSASAVTVMTVGTGRTYLPRQNRVYRITQTLLNGASATKYGDHAFTGIPLMILSLQGVDQAAPADGNTDYGFSC